MRAVMDWTNSRQYGHALASPIGEITAAICSDVNSSTELTPYTIPKVASIRKASCPPGFSPTRTNAMLAATTFGRSVFGQVSILMVCFNSGTRTAPGATAQALLCNRRSRSSTRRASGARSTAAFTLCLAAVSSFFFFFAIYATTLPSGRKVVPVVVILGDQDVASGSQVGASM